MNLLKSRDVATLFHFLFTENVQVYLLTKLAKSFTVSERVAIARAIEEEIGKGHGGDRKSNQVQNFVLENEGKKTIEIAAEKAGFGLSFADVTNAAG